MNRHLTDGIRNGGGRAEGRADGVVQVRDDAGDLRLSVRLVDGIGVLDVPGIGTIRIPLDGDDCGPVVSAALSTAHGRLRLFTTSSGEISGFQLPLADGYLDDGGGHPLCSTLIEGWL